MIAPPSPFSFHFTSTLTGFGLAAGKLSCFAGMSDRSNSRFISRWSSSSSWNGSQTSRPFHVISALSAPSCCFR